jgi:hypothetical protein
MCVPSRRPPFSEIDAREAIAAADCWAGALRALGYNVQAANYRTLQRYAIRWGISTVHFDPSAARSRAGRRRGIPLTDVLTPDSTYPRGRLKERLLQAGLKERRCEMCGQGEIWNGRRMSLVLDHIDGVSNDNRLENLRVVCANCAATLDTHCGRNLPRERVCPSCQRLFEPRHIRHRYCSRRCWGRLHSSYGPASYRGKPRPESRKVQRPSYEQLMADVRTMSFLAIGRKYGVSDNAVRKWIRWYENEAERGRSVETEEPREDRAA